MQPMNKNDKFSPRNSSKQMQNKNNPTQSFLTLIHQISQALNQNSPFTTALSKLWKQQWKYQQQQWKQQWKYQYWKQQYYYWKQYWKWKWKYWKQQQQRQRWKLKWKLKWKYLKKLGQILNKIKSRAQSVELQISKIKQAGIKDHGNIKGQIVSIQSSNSPTDNLRSRDLILALIPLISTLQHQLQQYQQHFKSLNQQPNKGKFYFSSSFMSLLKGMKDNTAEMGSFLQGKVKQLSCLISEMSQYQTQKLSQSLKISQDNWENLKSKVSQYESQLLAQRQKIKGLQINLIETNKTMESKIMKIQIQNDSLKKSYETKLEQTQKECREQIQRVNHTKQQYISKMTHQLKQENQQIFRAIKQTFGPICSILSVTAPLSDQIVEVLEYAQKSQPQGFENNKKINSCLQQIQKQLVQVEKNESSIKQFLDGSQPASSDCKSLLRDNLKYYSEQFARLNNVVGQLVTQIKSSITKLIELDKQTIQRKNQIQKFKLEFSQLSNLKTYFQNFKLKDQTIEEISSLKTQIITLKSTIEKLKSNHDSQHTKTIQQAITFIRRKQLQYSQKLTLSTPLNTHLIKGDYTKVVSKIEALEAQKTNLQRQIKSVQSKNTELSRQNMKIKGQNQTLEMQLKMHKDMVNDLKSKLYDQHKNSQTNTSKLALLQKVCKQINQTIVTSIRNLPILKSQKAQPLKSSYSFQNPAELNSVVGKAVQIYQQRCKEWERYSSQQQQILTNIIKVFEVNPSLQNEQKSKKLIVNDIAKQQIKAQIMESQLSQDQHNNSPAKNQKSQQTTQQSKLKQNQTLNHFILTVEKSISALNSQKQKSQQNPQINSVIKQSLQKLSTIYKLSKQIETNQAQIITQRDLIITNLQEQLEIQTQNVNIMNKRNMENQEQISILNDNLIKFKNFAAILQGIQINQNRQRPANPQILEGTSLTPTSKTPGNRPRILSVGGSNLSSKSSIELKRMTGPKLKKDITISIEQDKSQNYIQETSPQQEKKFTDKKTKPSYGKISKQKESLSDEYDDLGF